MRSEDGLYAGLVPIGYTGVMKMTFPLSSDPFDGAVRPGFDVLMAVNGARQAGSPTARRVAANRGTQNAPDSADQRRTLFAGKQINADLRQSAVARFADVGGLATQKPVAVDGLAIEINGPFTRAFQAMVKLGDVDPLHKAGSLGGAGSGKI
jgi:hypothetical protein